MFYRRVKLSHTRCFLPAFLFNRNEHDIEGTQVLDKKKVGGWQGVVKAFSHDEEGNPSPELRNLLSTTCYSALLGGVYGSFSYSKRAYDDFFIKNQSTLFQNQFEAKSKLQTQVSLAMGKGIFKWGTRIALFCGPFTAIVTAINAYKQKVSVISYASAGFIIGGLSRISMGIRGALVGSTLGGILGTLVGFLTLLIIKLSPVTMEEILEWQDKAYEERQQFFVREQRQSSVFQFEKSKDLDEHDERMKVQDTTSNKAT